MRPRPLRPAAPLLAALAAAGALSTPTAALAAGSIAILELRLAGVPPDLEPRFATAVEAALQAHGYEVVTARQASERLLRAAVAPGCTVGPCLQAVGSALGVQGVVVGTVAATGSSYDVVLTLLDAIAGAPRAQATEGCAICTMDEGVGVAGKAAERIAAAAPDLTQPAATGAATPAPPATPPHADARAAPVAEPRWLSGRRLRVVRTTAVVTGAVTAALGLVLLGLDGRCAEGPSCRDLLDTGVGGAALLGLGVGIGLGGVSLFLVGREPERRPAPGLAVRGTF